MYHNWHLNLANVNVWNVPSIVIGASKIRGDSDLEGASLIFRN